MPARYQSEPITPAREGTPPGWVVRCLECTFAHDVHASTVQEALDQGRALHPSHRGLMAQAVDYTTGYKTAPHPLYAAEITQRRTPDGTPENP